MKPKRKEWMTVLLVYPDYATSSFGAEVYIGWALVPKGPRYNRKLYIEQAVNIVRRKAYLANHKIHAADDFALLAVFDGRLTCIADSTSGV